MQAVRAAARPVAGIRRAAAGAARTYATPVPYSEFPPSKDPQLAGYPEVPYVSKQRRSPFGWDDPQMRRNFGEPPHEQEEILSMWGPDAPVVDPSRALRNFILAVGTFTGIGFLCYAIQPEMPAVRREYPFDGLQKELGGLEENKARAESLEDEE
ncbi:Ndufb8, NADH dehydrogenase 19kDa subunit [Phanerochaete sordida]|uniref:Ndufb8, NADH dehydrogenase 19kDa subunit n=1 Tax=Phanerochaete sordida TaxID=48140 RepID=A0A9P3G5J9_9APHY|nr:Ndufb8, NADH dehydrogenase 19kDa subunit [Phanerochaete sordida]